MFLKCTNITSQYEPKREGGLFVEYIYKYLKLNALASGYTDWVPTREDEDRYIDSFYEREGTRLNKDAIRPNAAKLGLRNLCLNSMWGKLTERNNRTKRKIIYPHELYRYLATPAIAVLKLVCWRLCSGPLGGLG
jgi:hypothetical protein